MEKRVVTALLLVLALVLAPVSGQLITKAAGENEAGGVESVSGGEGDVSGGTPTPDVSEGDKTPEPTTDPTTTPTEEPADPTTTPTEEPADPTTTPTQAPAPTQKPGSTGTGNNTVVATPTPAPSNNNSGSSAAPAPTPTPGIVVAEDGMYENVPESNWAEVNNTIASTVEAANTAAETGASVSKNIDVVVGRTVEVPAAVLNNLAGTDVTLALHVGEGIALSITGTDVAATETPFNMNLVASTVPAEVKDAVVASAAASREFSFEEQGAFPFLVNMHMNFGEENVGKVAVLYRYDEETGALVVAGTFIVNADGQAMFGLTEGGQYVAVVTENPATYMVAAGDTFGRIARKFNMTTEALKAVNPDVKNINKIRIGQVLNVR